MRIDVWSDVVCPWCYLGAKRLEAAIEQLDFGGEIDVRWHAFQLDPTATAQPKDLREAIDRKYGRGSFDGMTKRLTALGDDIGIDYRFDLAQRVTSLPALLLVAWVEQTYGPGRAAALHERLFRAYFTEGANIADPDNLRVWAVEAGAEEDLAAEAIAAGAGREQVIADLEQASARDITGVPCFVIEDRAVIPGAQDVETLKIMLTRVRDKLSA